MPHNSQDDIQRDANKKLKPVALILAGYNRVNKRARRKILKEIKEVYDGDEIYMGNNKFLYDLAGKPIIQYVLDAVYNAEKNGEPLYDKIYLYNDVKSFKERVDMSKYPNLTLRQMRESVGGHWKEFYFNFIEYGQKVDVFFGDTPRITPEDVEYIHNEFDSILGKKKDHRGVPISMIFGITEFDDLEDNWMEHRIKYIKVGANKGKLKNFVHFENFQARIGNTGAIIKLKGVDDIIRSGAINFYYNLRKALTPSSFSKIIYYLWKLKKLDMIRQVKNRKINVDDFITANLEVVSRLYKIDVSEFAGMMFHIKKNASRWENDIDGPKDFEVYQKKFRAMQNT